MQALRNVLTKPPTKSKVVFPASRYVRQCTKPNKLCVRFTSSTARPVFSRSSLARRTLVGTVCVSTFTAAFLYTPIAHAEAPAENGNQAPSPRFRLDEVRKHGRDAEEKWITKGNKVYNITDWIPGHPGGEVILRAVGGPVDQYWNIFTIHKKQDVYDILDTFYIGDVDPRDLVDGKVPVEHVDDPFKNDPKRDDRLIVHSARPFNAETPEEGLNAFITPDDLFYVRQHMWVPEVDETKHKLVIELADGEEKEYSLDDIKSRFKEVTVTATLQCSGNRRRHMTEESRSTNGLQWEGGAISNAEWTGVRLRDVLKDAGVQIDDIPNPEIKHVQFVGAEAYGASIPVEKAVDKLGDVLLAYKMNDKPLALDHGYPLRLLVPGTVAARSVKWITRIRLSDEESPSQWQRRDYKCFGPNISGNPDWDSAPAIQETPVQSAITSLRDVTPHSPQDAKLLQVYGLEEDSIAVEGYSFAGGGRRIIRVDVSANNGRSWQQAELLSPPKESSPKGAKAWAWTRWRWVLPRSQAGRCFVVKAVDEAYNTQPAEYEANYNFRGNLTSSWHRVGYRAKPL